jgi:hypothetical protein
MPHYVGLGVSQKLPAIFVSWKERGIPGPRTRPA